MNLVVGATGTLGLEISQRLCARGQPTRSFVRSGSPKGSLLRKMGAGIVYGDLKDESSLDAACHGVSVVITTANAILSRRSGDTLETVDRDGSLALIRASKRAGVRQFIFASGTPRLPTNNTFVRYKREVESALRSSGLNWTILQPCGFMETNTGPLAGWDLENGRARVIGSGRVPVCYIALADVAAFAIASIDNPNARNRNLHITGPEPLSSLDAIEIAERVTGRVFKSAGRRFESGASDSSALQPDPCIAPGDGIGGLDGEGTDMAPLHRQFGVQPTTFEQYVRLQTTARPS